MECIENLKTYSANLPKEWETELLVQIKKMRNKGFSYQWIEKAVTHKKPEEWQKWGFGLLHMEAYQKQINNLLVKEKEQLRDIDTSSISWDDFEKDIETSRNNTIQISKSIESKPSQSNYSEHRNNFSEIKKLSIDNNLYNNLKEIISYE